MFALTPTLPRRCRALPSQPFHHAGHRQSRAVRYGPQRRVRPRPPCRHGPLLAQAVGLHQEAGLLVPPMTEFAVLVPTLHRQEEQPPIPRSSIPLRISFLPLLFSPDWRFPAVSLLHLVSARDELLAATRHFLPANPLGSIHLPALHSLANPALPAHLVACGHARWQLPPFRMANCPAEG